MAGGVLRPELFDFTAVNAVAEVVEKATERNRPETAPRYVPLALLCFDPMLAS